MDITILLIEDNIYKAIDIERALETCGIKKIIRVGYQEAALEIIKSNKAINLIVTDMRYPLYRGGDEDIEAGFKLVTAIKNMKLQIPVVLCSTSNYETVSDVYGTVWYSELNDIKRDFQKIIEKLRNERYP